MKTKVLFLLLFLGSLGFNCFGNVDVPEAISPGMAGGIGVVENRCPTFSWSGVAWAQKYRVVVFGIEADGKKINDEIALTPKPLLSEDIAGGGLSWTPSSSQGLAEGADYTWYVGAMDAGGTWAWSESRRFRIEASTRLALNAGNKNDSRQQANDKKSLRAASDLSESNATSKDSAASGPEGPLGSEGDNTKYGLSAGASTTTGLYNTFIGRNAGSNTTTASNNTFIGDSSGINNTTGIQNTFLGRDSGYHSTLGSYNTFIGDSAGVMHSEGFYNTFLGHKAGYNDTSGGYNTFIGNESGYANTTGTANIFLGHYSGYSNTTANYNTFIGLNAGYGNTTGASNTFIGKEAGQGNNTGNGNIFLGFEAGYNETGSDKLFIENSRSASPLIYGNFATDMVGINGWFGVGTQAPTYPMELKTTGRNAAIVANRTDGATNFINATTAYGQFGTVNNFPVRILANSIWRLTLNTDNSLAMANGASCTTGGVWTNASSLALKQDVAPLNAEAAAAALRELNPVTYAYKADASEQYVGFIAEEVPELVAMNDRKALSPMDIVAVLTKVVQEQQKIVQEQQKALLILQAKFSALEKKVKEIK